jgi:hypothetical protein
LIAARIYSGTSNAGAPTTLRELAYNEDDEECEFTVYANNFTLPVLTSQTVYRNDAGTIDIVTTYRYTWHGTTAGVDERTIQLPTVPTDQNGTNNTVYRRELYDIYGNQTAQQDERDYITTFAYDLPTGATKQIVQDANPPDDSGWNRPGEPGAMQLTTDNSIDDEGRVTESLGPAHDADISGMKREIRSATWNVYRDHCSTSYDETWSAQGFYCAALSPTRYLINPVSISRTVRTGLSSDRIAATRGSTAVSSGTLSEANSFPQTAWVRWTQEEYNEQGQRTTSRLYHQIPTSGAGSPVTNYNDTTYDYNADTGRQDGAASPRGTITRSVFDIRGRLTSTWIGTNDTGFTYANPTNSGGGGNNLVQLSANT